MLLGLAAGGGVLAEPPPEKPPVPLRRPAPLTPVETVGTGLAPAVGVRVGVDERGNVSSVEITGIRPSSPYDRLFEREVKATLADWRFAPAIRDGVPVATHLEWTIQFPTRESQAADWRITTWTVEDRFDQLRRVYLLPLERQRAHLEKIVAIAERGIVPGRRKAVEDGNVVAVTDSPQPEAAAMVARNVRAAEGVLDDLFHGKLTPQPEELKLYVYVYSTRSAYQSLVASQTGLPGTDGFYNSPGLIAVHLELPANEFLLTTLLQEVAYVYLDRRVMKPGAVLPVWLAEGFAQYVGNSEIRDGKLILGGYRQHAVYHSTAGTWRGKSLAQEDAEGVKKAIAKGEAIPLDQLVAAGRTEFYGGKFRLFGTEAWMLVHFLRHGRPGWDENEFPRFMLYVAEGFSPSEAFREVYAAEPASFEQAFREYAARF
jgi:TonB family protein